MMITLARFDNDGYFAHFEAWEESALQLNGKGQYFLPKNSTETLPPSDPQEGYRWHWNGTTWVEELKPEQGNTPSPPQISFHPDRFLLNSTQSQLYQMGKNSQGQARIEFEEVRGIINGRLLFLAAVRVEEGLLQKNLQELVMALGDEATGSAIAEFNQLLKDDLGVEWTI